MEGTVNMKYSQCDVRSKGGTIMGETVNGRYSVCVCDSEIGMLGE